MCIRDSCCNKFNPNQLDGVFGAGAERAVKEFQEFVGLIADGKMCIRDRC